MIPMLKMYGGSSGTLKLAALARAVEFLKPFANDSHILAYTSSMTACNQYMNKTRSATLCYICSSQNSKFFTNRKAVISQADCSTMLSKCFFFFNITIELFGVARDFLENIGSQNTSNWQQLGSFIKTNYAYMEKSGIPSLLSSYKKSIDQIQKQKSANQICARSFRLHKDPIFGAVEGLMESVQFLLNSSSISSSTSTARGMQITSSVQDPFIGDVAILQPSDNMFVSYDGTQGSTLSNTGGYTPMNLSLIFP